MNVIVQNLLSALGGAIITGGITIWYKNRELRLKKRELVEIQKENSLKDRKFEQTKLDRILDYALSGGLYDTKVNAIKQFSQILSIIENDVLFGERMFDDYESDLSMSIAKSLDYIILQSGKLIDAYPQIFNKIWVDLAKNRDFAIEVRKNIMELEDDGPSYDQCVFTFSPDLIKLYNNLKLNLENMKSEFRELDALRQEFIKTQKPIE